MNPLAAIVRKTAVLAVAIAAAGGFSVRLVADTNDTTVITLGKWSQEFVTLSVAGWGVTTNTAGAAAFYNFGQVVSAPELTFLQAATSTNGGTISFPSVPGTPVTVDSASRALIHTVAVACGEFHTLLLRRDGSVAATGWNSVGQATVPEGLSNVVAIACGADHSLALRRDGRVVAWGWNRDGQSQVPAELGAARAIAGGGFHSLALLESGRVAAWGRTAEGQCQVPAGLDRVAAIAAGARHSLALRTDGTVVAWGDNSSGQCDVPANLDGVVEVSAGAYFSLARRANGTVVGWGDVAQGQSTPPEGLSQVVQIAAGEFHALALRADGTVVGWGDDTYQAVSVPAGMSNVVAVAAGGYHSEALIQTLPPLGRPRLETGRFLIDLNLPAGRRYRLEASPDLRGWTAVSTNTVIPGNMTLEPGVVGSDVGARFFRAWLLP